MFQVTYEAPPGIKKNLQRTYEILSADLISKGSAIRSQAIFVLSWFHAVIQERRMYIPQGWTKFYEFTAADLRSATRVCDAATLEGGISWTDVHGLLKYAIYGGRIDNDFDFRVLEVGFGSLCYVFQPL